MCKIGGGDHRCPSSTSRSNGGSRLSRSALSREVRATAYSVADEAFIRDQNDGITQTTSDETFINRNGGDNRVVLGETVAEFSQVPADVAKQYLRVGRTVTNEVGEAVHAAVAIGGSPKLSEKKIKQLARDLRTRESVVKAAVSNATYAHSVDEWRKQALDEVGKKYVNHHTVGEAWMDAYQGNADEYALPAGVGQDREYLHGQSKALSDIDRVFSFAREDALTVAELDRRLSKLKAPSDPALRDGYTATLRELRNNVATMMTREDSSRAADSSPFVPTKDAPAVSMQALWNRAEMVKNVGLFAEGQRVRVHFDNDTVLDGKVHVSGRGKDRTVLVEHEATGVTRELYSSNLNNLTPFNIEGVRLIP